MLARRHFTKSQFDLRYVNPSKVIKEAAERKAVAAKKVQKVKKSKTTPIALGDVFGFGISTV
jgi:hypothetical protein